MHLGRLCDLLRDHTTLACRSVYRIFLEGYVPLLQTPGGAVRYLLSQRGFPMPSSAAFGKIGEQYVAEIRRWAKQHGVLEHQFEKGENKELYARPLIDAAAREGGEGRVVLLGIAQERASVWRSWRVKDYPSGRPQMAWGRQKAVINHFYFYLWDPDWGPAFWNTNGYSPYSIWIYLNGHEWAKRQLEKAGIEYQALDNGFRSSPPGRSTTSRRAGPSAPRPRSPTPATSGWAGASTPRTGRALRGVGQAANRRLCDAQAQDAKPAPDVVTVNQVTRPSKTTDGLHAPALCFGDPRVMALLTALVSFSHVLAGFRNRQVVELVATLLYAPYSSRQASYDLRRFASKGLIARLPRSQRYHLTALGRAVAVLFLKAHGRILGSGLALVDVALPDDIARGSPLTVAWRRLDATLDDFLERQMIAA